MSVDNLEGKQLGKYVLDQKLASGGMGAVYQSTHPDLNIPVCIKVIHANYGADPSYIDRFKREARIVAQFTNDYITKIYDLGVQDDIDYIVMKYYVGGTLAHLIAQGPIPIDRTLEILEQIAEGLEYAHQRNIAHRDIKPSNVMFDEDGKAVVVDFGAAKDLNSSSIITQSGSFIGTLHYVAPEQLDSTNVIDHRADLYSLAVMTYQMLTGSYLFDSTNMGELVRMHWVETPDLSDLSNYDADAAIPVLQVALAKRPDARFDSVKSFFDELKQALTDVNYDASSVIALSQSFGPPTELIPQNVNRQISRLNRIEPPERNTQLDTTIPNRNDQNTDSVTLTVPVFWRGRAAIFLVTIFFALIALGFFFSYQSSQQQALSNTQDAQTLVARQSETPAIFVSRNRIEAYAGPGFRYPLIDTLTSGSDVPVNGISQDGDWYQINIDGTQAWVRRDSPFFDTSGAIGGIPIAEAPTDTPTWTPSPTNTPTHTPTHTATNTPTDTPTHTPTNTATNTPTYTPSLTLTPTATSTYTHTPTATASRTPTSTPSDIPTPSTPTLIVRATSLPVRSGPGVSYERLGTIALNEQFPVLGITEDGGWYSIELPDGTLVWVGNTPAVMIIGPVEDVLVVSTPTPTASPTPLPTATPELTLVSLRKPETRGEALQYSSVWETVGFDDISSPGEVNYEMPVDPRHPLRVSFNWCASSEADLAQVMRILTVEFYLNGVQLNLDDFLRSNDVPRSTVVCTFWDTIMENWTPNEEIELTVYYALDAQIQDSTIEYGGGEYYHRVLLDTSSENIICPKTRPSQLQAGENARILPGGNASLRSQPQLGDASRVGSVIAGSLVEIVNGPICNDGFTWWNVYYNTGRQPDNLDEIYWVAEVGPDAYIMEPLVTAAQYLELAIDPRPSQYGVFTAYQAFERGHMFWINPLEQIWVLYDNGQWVVFDDKVVPADWSQRDADLPPPSPGLFEPISGFEIVWETQPNVRSRLGWATMEEVGYLNSLQYFPNEGRLTLMNNGSTRFELFVNGNWRIDNGE